MDMLGPIPYCQINTLFDAALPRGARNYWKSRFLNALTDDAIRAMVDTYASVTSPMSQLLLEHFHGAAARVAPDATAFPHRQVGYNLVMVSQWTTPAEDQRHVAWTRERYAALQPFARRALLELPRSRRHNRCRGSRVRSELPAAAADQGEVRPRQLLPAEPEHQAGGSRIRAARRCGQRGCARSCAVLVAALPLSTRR